MTREKPKLKDYYLKTTRLIDSTAGKPYISLIQVFDKDGKHKMDFELNRYGDTIARIETLYPENLTEIQIHSYITAISDTAIFKYNERNQQTVEIWKWGEDKAIDTTFFSYDDNNKLIAKSDIYDFGTFTDSLFYENNKLIRSISYDESDVTDSVLYYYENNKMVGIKKYNPESELISDYQIEIGKFDKPKRIVNIYKSHNSNSFDIKTVTLIEYHNKDQIKSKIISRSTNGKLEETIELYYSKYGYLQESKTTRGGAKTISANKITLHNNT